MSEKMPREQIALLKNVIEDLQERVQTASESISAIVQTLDEQHDEAAQPDFERLRYESEKQAYKGHPAARSTMPELYFLLLVSVLTAADATQAQWRHLYRTAAGAGYEADVRDLLPDAYSLTDAKLIEAVDSIERDALVNACVLDCLLLALLHEGDAAALLAYIADLFALLGAEKKVVIATMHAAKTIVAQDREAYLEMMAFTHLAARESCCYLFHADVMTVINDLTQPESIASQHLMIVGLAKINITLDLDTWQAGKITFRNCEFVNSKITSSKREVHFINCFFYGDRRHAGATYLKIKNKSSFTRCLFQFIISKNCSLFLSNTVLNDCIFSDCSVRIPPLLSLSSSKITDSEFLDCRSDEGDFYHDHLFAVNKSSVMRCTFSDCKINGGETIIDARQHSTVANCRFEQCAVKNGYETSRYMLKLYEATQTNNTFHDCTCGRHVV
jgi:hypothetical protein